MEGKFEQMTHVANYLPSIGWNFFFFLNFSNNVKMTVSGHLLIQIFLRFMINEIVAFLHVFLL